jgi:hypothetical protein
MCAIFDKFKLFVVIRVLQVAAYFKGYLDIGIWWYAFQPQHFASALGNSFKQAIVGSSRGDFAN